MSVNPPKRRPVVIAVIVIASAVFLTIVAVVVALIFAFTKAPSPQRDQSDEEDDPESSQIVLDATWADGSEMTDSDLRSTQTVITERLADADIIPADFSARSGQITITFDDEADADTLDEAADILEVTFNADFRPVLEAGECDPDKEYTDPGPDEEATLCDQNEYEALTMGPSQVGADTILGATTFRQDIGGYWGVKITFDPSGAAALGELTRQAFEAGEGHNRVAIVLDGEVLSAPTVTAAIMDGAVSITGNFTEPDVDEFAAQLRFASKGLTLSVDSTYLLE